MNAVSPAGTRRARLAHEMREYLTLSLYLYVCLGAIFLYRATLLDDHGPIHLQVGLAAAKALVLAKFIMLGRVAGVGEHLPGRPLVRSVLRTSLVFLVVLAVLTAIEELAVAAFHRGGPEGMLAEVAGGRWAEVAASAFLLWLILLPYLALRHLQEALGPEAVRRLLFGGP